MQICNAAHVFCVSAYLDNEKQVLRLSLRNLSPDKVDRYFWVTAPRHLMVDVHEGDLIFGFGDPDSFLYLARLSYSEPDARMYTINQVFGVSVPLSAESLARIRKGADVYLSLPVAVPENDSTLTAEFVKIPVAIRPVVERGANESE